MFTPPNVSQITKAYQGNPDPLNAKVEQDKKQNNGIPQDLRQLMAAYDIAKGKNAAGIQQALQTPTDMPTVAQNTQEQARQAIQARMMQQMQQGQPNVVPQGTPEPRMQAKGIDALRTNVGEGYADGGIIGHTQHFQSKGSVQDPEVKKEEEATSQGGDLVRSILDAIGGGLKRTVDYGKLKSQKEEATPGFFESLTPTQRAERLKQAALLRTQMGQVADTGEVKVPYPEAGKPTYDRPVGQSDFDREYQKVVRQTPGMRAAEAAAPAIKRSNAAASSGQRVNAPVEPEAPAVAPTVAAPVAQTEAYKKLAEMMAQDPEAKAKALRDRYNREVGPRDLSIYDKTAEELQARKEKLNAPKAGYDALMDYLENIAESGGKDWQSAGAGGAALSKKKRLAREAEQNTLMDKILELGGKKSEAQFGERKAMFDMTEKERDDIYKQAFDAAKSVNASDDEAKRIAAQAVEKELDRKAQAAENEKNRKNQIRAAQIGAQDRDQLMNRAKALMAIDKTLTLDKAMQRAAEIAATGQLGAAEMRSNAAADTTRAKIREKYSWIDMLPANDPTKKAMAAERDRALAAVGSGAGLPDAVTSAPTGKVKFVGYE
jgi:hypothetical protein